MKNVIEEKFNISFVESKSDEYDLFIGERSTADGYSIHIVGTTNDEKMDDEFFEYCVYYYQPTVDQLLGKIQDLEPSSKVYCEFFEEYFDEDEVMDYIENT